MEHNNSNNDNVYNIDLVTATKEKYVAYLLENSKALGFSTKDSIDLPFAVDKTGALILLSIGDGQQGNALIIGTAGSGKSTIIHTMLGSALNQYEKDELEVWLVDYCWLNIEYKTYQEAQPSIIKRYVGDASTCKPSDLLRELYDTMQERKRILSLSKAANYSLFRSQNHFDTLKMPRVLVVFDSYDMMHDLIKNDSESKAYIKRLIQEGWSTGIHLVFACFPRFYSELSTITSNKVILGSINSYSIRTDFNVNVPDEYFRLVEEQKKGIGLFQENGITQIIWGIRINRDYPSKAHKKDAETIFNSDVTRLSMHRLSMQRQIPNPNHGKYGIDLVFCIDNSCCLKFEDLYRIKHLVESFPSRAKAFLEGIGTNQYYQLLFRTRIITFNNYEVEHDNTIKLSDFCDPFEEQNEYVKLVNSIQYIDADQELNCDGLEALAYGIRSNWMMKNQSTKRRHIVCVISGRVTNGLRDHSDCEGYPEYMADSFSQLQSWWDDNIDIDCKRLLLLTPDKSWWRYIVETWKNEILAPYDYYQELKLNEQKMNEMIHDIMTAFFEL